MDRVTMAHLNGYKMQTTYLLVVFVIVVQHTFAGTFPNFINKCKTCDPKFDDCVLDSANELIPTVINGDAKYGIAPLLPVNFTRIYNFTEIFGMKFTNLSVYANDGLVITDIHFDFQKNILTFIAKSCRIEFTGEYTTIGKCPGNLRRERGHANMTFDDVEFNVAMPFHYKTVSDKKYLEAVSCKLVFSGKNFRYKPNFRLRSRVDPGEMTSEHERQYQAGIDKIPQLMKSDIELLDEELVVALNKIFALLPFEELFSR